MHSPAVVTLLEKIAGVVGPDDGQDLMEYGLLVALIAIIALGAVTTVGNTITSVFWNVIAASSV